MLIAAKAVAGAFSSGARMQSWPMRAMFRPLAQAVIGHGRLFRSVREMNELPTIMDSNALMNA